MNFFVISSFVALATSAKNVTQADVYGEAPVITSMSPWHLKSRTRPARSSSYFAHRTVEDCTFPLEIVILQDATASFQDDYLIMKNVQLPLLINTMANEHPGSQFAVTSFRDKPIWSLGESATDYCVKFEQSLTADPDLIYGVYDTLISTGGGDPAESQYTGLVAVSQSQTPGWSNPDATRLIVVSTDAPPHWENDGLQSPSYNMKPFSGHFDEKNAAAQCLGEYYPSPEVVKNAINAREAYAAFLIFDGSWWNELPTKSWQWFNAYLGQSAEFVEPLGNNSTTFWESLSKVIQTIESVECADTTPTPTMTTPEPIVTITSPEPECPPHGSCPPCPCHGHPHCHCAEVVIKLAHRPKRMRLEVEN